MTQEKIIEEWGGSLNYIKRDGIKVNIAEEMNRLAKEKFEEKNESNIIIFDSSGNPI